MPTPTMAPTSTGYADVHGLHLYHEVYGSNPGRPPLVLIHGGMLGIDYNFGTLIPTLAQTHTVVGVELQGHGRTADIDRPVTYPLLAADVVALLDHLGYDRATVVGHSVGGGIALELVTAHRDRVSAVVPISASISKDGAHPDLSDPEKFATSPIMPTAEEFAEFRADYDRLSPHPDHFDEFLVKMQQMDADFRGWSAEQLAAVDVPVLLVQGDRDFTTVAHAAVMLDAIPGAELAVIPGTTHMAVTRRASILLPILAAFLDNHAGL